MRSRARAALAAALVCVVPLIAACDFAGTANSPLVVETEYGKLRGIETEGIRAWRGIPFAAPPEGDLRWAPPEEPESWDGIRNARQYGAPCIQGGPTPGQTGVKVFPGSSEDCLYLNVNAPKDAEDAPVMVFIHGGGFVVGTGARPIANTPALVERGAVLVTINYRLGRFGFFAHPSLESDVANFGLLDQIAALEWVKDNIEGFGGDPDNVTIFGQSAGGMSVNALMVSPQARGLFHKAIVESGLGREQSVSLEESRDQGEEYLPGMDADQLRDLDAERILGPPQDVLGGDMPIVDEVLPQRVADAFAEGAEADIPYIVGTTSAEFPDGFLERLGRQPDAARTLLVGDERDRFVSAYGNEQNFRFHVLSDAIFTEPARFLAQQHAKRAPSYLYRFSVATPQEIAFQGGAAHSAEAPYVFDWQVGEDNPTARVIGDYWVQFAKTGDPNTGDDPEWPPADDGALINFSNEGAITVRNDPWKARLDAVEAASRRIATARS